MGKKQIILGFIAIIVITSCTKDEFFGIDSTPSIDIYTMQDIAMSKEFSDFTLACISFLEKLNTIDTTKKSAYTIRNGETVLHWVSDSNSYKKVLEHRNILFQTYSVLQQADLYDMHQIQQIAFSKNSALRNITSINKHQYFKRTKDSNYESQAESWISYSTNNNGYIYDSESQCWRKKICIDSTPIESYYYTWTIHLFLDAFDAIDCAQDMSMSTNKETGGFVWYDQSALVFFHEQATNTAMYTPKIQGNPLPYYDFHFHPSGNLIPSEYDWDTWRERPTAYHFIFNYEGYYSCFWQ